MRTFVHSGDIGDIIFALPTIRAVGGGDLVITHTEGKTAHGMNADKVERLRPLLELQPYIASVRFDPDAVPTSIDGFRNHSGAGNLADMHLATHAISWRARIAPWISVDTPDPSYEVLFAKTHRYNNPGFDWGIIYEKYKHKAAFLGFKDEHATFESNYGKIPLIDTKCFLQIARLVAGCKLYVGNYTSVTAIAEGMKHKQMLVEVFPKDHHLGVFQRFGCLLGWDHKIELPEV